MRHVCLALSMEDLDRLIRVLPEERDLDWVHELCNVSRYIHLDVWGCCCEHSYVEEAVLQLFRKTVRELDAMATVGGISSAMKRAVVVAKRNVTIRIKNLEENYLQGKPSRCEPPSDCDDLRAKIVSNDGKRKGIHIEYHEGPTMRFGDVHISGGNVNFADGIGQIQYKQQYGITKQRYDEFIASIAALSEENKVLLNKRFAELAKADTEEKKKSAAEKILHFLLKKGVDVAKDITVEFMKRWFWPQ